MRCLVKKRSGCSHALDTSRKKLQSLKKSSTGEREHFSTRDKRISALNQAQGKSIRSISVTSPRQSPKPMLKKDASKKSRESWSIPPVKEHTDPETGMKYYENESGRVAWTKDELFTKSSPAGSGKGKLQIKAEGSSKGLGRTQTVKDLKDFWREFKAQETEMISTDTGDAGKDGIMPMHEMLVTLENVKRNKVLRDTFNSFFDLDFSYDSSSISYAQSRRRFQANDSHLRLVS